MKVAFLFVQPNIKWDYKNQVKTTHSRVKSIIINLFYWVEIY